MLLLNQLLNSQYFPINKSSRAITLDFKAQGGQSIELLSTEKLYRGSERSAQNWNFPNAPTSKIGTGAVTFETLPKWYLALLERVCTGWLAFPVWKYLPFPVKTAWVFSSVQWNVPRRSLSNNRF